MRGRQAQQSRARALQDLRGCDRREQQARVDELLVSDRPLLASVVAFTGVALLVLVANR